MEDPQVVAAIRAGDPAGLAAAYDRYAMPLFAYCRSMLPEPADAADVVQDTFLAATIQLSDLRDPARLRPWLYAVARNECLRRLRTGSLTATLEEAADLPADIEAADPAVRAERADLRALIRSAIDGLNLKDRDIVELSLVHELGGNDLADVLGVSSNHAHALMSRARSQMEKSLGALIVARSGRRACPELAAMLDGWDGQLTVLMRKRINRHLERCKTCDERKRRELSPALLVGVTPVAALLPGFRDQVLRLMAGYSPARLAAAQRVVPSGSSGFPRAMRVPGAHWRQAAHQSHVLAAGTVTSAMAIGAVVVVGISGPHPGMPPDAAGSTHAAAVSPRPGTGPRSGGTSPVLSVQAAPGSPGTAGQRGKPRPSGQPGSPTAVTSGRPSPSSATPAPSPSPSTGPGTPSPSPGTGTPSPSPSTVAPSPSPSPIAPSPSPSTLPPSPGTLAVSPTVLDPVDVNGTPIGSLTLTAEGGPVSDYSVSVGPGLVGEVAVSPSSGSLAAGASVTVTVTVTSLLVVNAQITVNPGDHTVEVLLGI